MKYQNQLHHVANNVGSFLERVNVFQIIICAVILRLLWIVLIPATPVSDYLWYYDRAGEIAAGNGYSINGIPTAYWPIGYPALLGLLFFLTGKSVLAAQLLNVLLTGGIIFLFSLLLKDHGVNKKSISLSALVIALSLNYIAYTGILQTETVSLFLMLAAILFTARFFNTRKIILLIAASVCYGLLIYVKPQSFFLPVVIYTVYYFKSGRISFRYLLYLYGIVIFMLVPWTVRNYSIYGALIPVSTNGGINFYVGNGPGATGKYREGFVFPETKNGAEESRVGLQLGLKNIVDNPVNWIKLIPLKLYYLYRDDVDGIMWTMVSTDAKYTPFLRVLKWLWQAMYIMVMILFFISILKSIKQRLSLIEILSFSIISYYSLIVILFFGISRFHYVVFPFIVLTLGNVLIEGRKKIKYIS